eukprot:gene868-162_t
MQIDDETGQTENFDTSSLEQSSTVSSVEKTWESLAAISHELGTEDESGRSSLHVSLDEGPNISTSATATKKQTIAVPVKRMSQSFNISKEQPVIEERKKEPRKGAWSKGNKPVSSIEMDREFVNTMKSVKKAIDDEPRQLKPNLEPHQKVMAKFQIMKIFNDIETAKRQEAQQQFAYPTPCYSDANIIPYRQHGYNPYMNFQSQPKQTSIGKSVYTEQQPGYQAEMHETDLTSL